MEKSKTIYLLWWRDELITYFEEDELDDLFELIVDLNFEEAYTAFCKRLNSDSDFDEYESEEERLAYAIDFSEYAECWHWCELEKKV